MAPVVAAPGERGLRDGGGGDVGGGDRGGPGPDRDEPPKAARQVREEGKADGGGGGGE